MRKLFYVLGIALGSVLCLAMPSWAAEEETNSTAPAFGNFSQENDQIELPGTLVGGVDFTGVVPELPADSEYWTPQRLAGVEKAMQAGLMVLEGAVTVAPNLETPIDEEAKLTSLMERVASGLEGDTATSAGFNLDLEQGTLFIVTDRVGIELITSAWKTDADFALIEFQETEPFGISSEEIWSGGGSFEGTCTGAFPAIRGNVIGVISAAHCFEDENTAPITYEGIILQSVVLPTTTIDDVAFLGLPGSTTELTRTSSTSMEFMYLARNPLLGENVCHFGISSGKQCSTIRSRFQQAVIMGEPVKNIAIVQQDVSAPGDSGGPWYSNTVTKTAVGIHKGVIYFEGAFRSFFTMIASISAVGATLLLSGIQ